MSAEADRRTRTRIPIEDIMDLPPGSPYGMSVDGQRVYVGDIVYPAKKRSAPQSAGSVAISGANTEQPGFTPEELTTIGGPHPESLDFGRRNDPGIDTTIAGYDDTIHSFFWDEFPGYENL